MESLLLDIENVKQACLFTLLFQSGLAVLSVGTAGGLAAVWLLVPPARRRLYRWSTSERQRKRDRHLAALDEDAEGRLADIFVRPIVIDISSEDPCQ